jgi:hypothetical protein
MSRFVRAGQCVSYRKADCTAMGTEPVNVTPAYGPNEDSSLFMPAGLAEVRHDVAHIELFEWKERVK